MEGNNIGEEEDMLLVGQYMISQSEKDDIRNRAITLRWVTLGIGLGLFVLSFVNLLAFYKYKKQEEVYA